MSLSSVMVNSFQIQLRAHPQQKTRLLAAGDDNNSSPLFGDSDASDSSSFDNFNPFQKKVTYASKRAPQVLGTGTGAISLRKMRMNELMGKLLKADTNPESDELQTLMLGEEELIMEPLEEEKSVGIMEEDSIYEEGMTREERFDRYDEVMEERLEKAVNKKVEVILTELRKFVSSRR